jgi:hypothetical protein
MEGLERFNPLMIDALCNRQEHGATFDTDFLEELKFRYASGVDAASRQSPEEGEVITVAVSRPTNCCYRMQTCLVEAHG